MSNHGRTPEYEKAKLLFEKFIENALTSKEFLSRWHMLNPDEEDEIVVMHGCVIWADETRDKFLRFCRDLLVKRCPACEDVYRRATEKARSRGRMRPG